MAATRAGAVLLAADWREPRQVSGQCWFEADRRMIKGHGRLQAAPARYNRRQVCGPTAPEAK